MRERERETDRQTDRQTEIESQKRLSRGSKNILKICWCGVQALGKRVSKRKQTTDIATQRNG